MLTRQTAERSRQMVRRSGSEASSPRHTDVMIRIGRNTVPMPNGCLAYKGDLTRSGTVQFHLPDGTSTAQRPADLVLEQVIGRQLKGYAQHTCGNLGCVNPKHLRCPDLPPDVTPTPRLRNTEWQRVRKQVLDASDICYLCGEPGADTVDHVVPLIQGGDEFDPTNLRPACKSCNSRKGQTERRPRERKTKAIPVSR